MSSSPTSRAFHFGTSCDYAVSEVECTYTEMMHQPFDAIQSLVAMLSLEQFAPLIKMLTCRATEHAIAPVHHLPPESEKRIDVVKKMKVDHFFHSFHLESCELCTQTTLKHVKEMQPPACQMLCIRATHELLVATDAWHG